MIDNNSNSSKDLSTSKTNTELKKYQPNSKRQPRPRDLFLNKQPPTDAAARYKQQQKNTIV